MNGSCEWPGRFIAGEELWATVDGYRMRYLRVQARRACGAPPLVLVHGLLGYSFSWRFNLEALSEDRDVYAIDLLGIGFSERPPRDAVSYNLRASAERVLNWMVQLGLRNADVVGTSHGGGVAMMMAGLDRDRGTGLIGRLVLVASIHPWSKAGLRRTKLLGNPVGALVFRTVAPMCGIFSFARGLMLERMYGDPRKITEQTRQGYDVPIRLKGTVDYALGIVRHWHRDMQELKQVVGRISGIPVLLVWGGRDAVVKASSALELKENLRYSELVILEAAGHLPYEESPEEFNRTLRKFLARAYRSEDLSSAGLGVGQNQPS